MESKENKNISHESETNYDDNDFLRINSTPNRPNHFNYSNIKIGQNNEEMSWCPEKEQPLEELPYTILRNNPFTDYSLPPEFKDSDQS